MNRDNNLENIILDLFNEYSKWLNKNNKSDTLENYVYWYSKVIHIDIDLIYKISLY